jgi:SAM-dependent methyltransferase
VGWRSRHILFRPGSETEFARQFADFLNAFVDERGVKSIVDLGCGDFRVGQLIERPGIRYTGVDVVDALVHRNQERSGRDRIEFRTIDILQDELPDGDLCVLRQVLQRLSNTEIQKILHKLNGYKFSIVAKHHPAPARLTVENLDRQTRFDTRIESGSGVFLEKPPFGVASAKVLKRLSIPPLRDPGEILTVYLLEGNA